MGRGKLAAGVIVFVLLVAGMWTTIIALDWKPALGLDLQGGVSITLAPAAGQDVDQAVLDQTVGIVRNRVDALGVGEPDITRQGDNVVVQLPGVADQEQAENIIGQTAQLQTRPVLDIIPAGDERYAEMGEACNTSAGGVPPATEEVVLCEETRGQPAEGDTVGALLPKDQWTKYRLGPAALVGDDVDDAQA